MRKKRVLIHSNFCKMFTGFGKHKKNLLSYLYKTGKYELIELSNGFVWSSENLKYMPWDSYGTLPDDTEIHKEIAADERRKNLAGYGTEMIDYQPSWSIFYSYEKSTNKSAFMKETFLFLPLLKI